MFSFRSIMALVSSLLFIMILLSFTYFQFVQLSLIKKMKVTTSNFFTWNLILVWVIFLLKKSSAEIVVYDFLGGYWSDPFPYFNILFLEQVVSGNSKGKMFHGNSKVNIKFLNLLPIYLHTYLFISFTWDFWITLNEKV